MSAFLHFSKAHREEVKKAHPGIGTIAISAILSTMWKEASPEEKKFFLDNDEVQREKYKNEMDIYKKKKEGERKKREEYAVLRAVGAGLCSAVGLCSESPVDEKEMAFSQHETSAIETDAIKCRVPPE